MGDEQRRVEKKMWEQGSYVRPETLRSSSDRLRPPYMHPLPWVDPQTPEASRMWEQGFLGLPKEWQKILGQAPTTPQFPVGTMDKNRWDMDGTLSGLTMRYLPQAADKLKKEYNLPPKWATATDPTSAAHELIHMYYSQNPRERAPYRSGRRLEEQLAGNVSGRPSLGPASDTHLQDMAAARDWDERNTAEALGPTDMIGEFVRVFGDIVSRMRGSNGTRR